MRTLILWIFVALLLLGCNDSRTAQPLNSPARPRAAITLSAAEDGRQIFEANCAPCHGRNADGNTPAGRTWRVPDLHSQQVQSLADEQLLEIVRNGKGKMPAWGGLLSQIDITHVLTYVRTMRGEGQK